MIPSPFHPHQWLIPSNSRSLSLYPSLLIPLLQPEQIPFTWKMHSFPICCSSSDPLSSAHLTQADLRWWTVAASSWQTRGAIVLTYFTSLNLHSSSAFFPHVHSAKIVPVFFFHFCQRVPLLELSHTCLEFSSSLKKYIWLCLLNYRVSSYMALFSWLAQEWYRYPVCVCELLWHLYINLSQHLPSCAKAIHPCAASHTQLQGTWIQKLCTNNILKFSNHLLLSAQPRNNTQ